jgi:hypothetical protein
MEGDRNYDGINIVVPIGPFSGDLKGEVELREGGSNSHIGILSNPEPVRRFPPGFNT